MKQVLPIVSSLLLAASVYSEVNESSGTMVLSQQLCEVKGNTISLPLSLHYSAGITIDQRASWVGLGFDLSLPYIERIPQGSADEKEGGFSFNGSPDGSETWFYSDKHYDKLITEKGNGYNSNPAPGNYTNQQDYYRLSASFASGRIIFGEPPNKKTPMVAYLQNWRPVKIDYRISESDDIYRWEITDEAGVKYVFGGDAGIVRAFANIDNSKENTVRTFPGKDDEWQTIGNDRIKIYDHYINPAFNIRWYLTEIISPNNSESIRVTYTPYNADYSVWVRDLFCYPDKTEQTAATSLFRYEQAGHRYAQFSFGQDNYHIHPVYPVDIIGPTSKVHFTMNTSPDILVQGDKRIESIELYTRDNASDNDCRFVSRYRMNYSSTGLSEGHPYSSEGRGRLQLMSVSRYAQNDCLSYPLLRFDYVSNPDFTSDGYFMHDFYGYYCHTPLTRVSDEYKYPVGQSHIGTSKEPDAEAWSIQRIIYPDGKIMKYTYEPNTATISSINQPLSSNENRVMPGIRVAMEQVYDGVTETPLIATYSYDNGYTGYRAAIGTDINDFYTTINSGEYKTIRNIMVLSGTGVLYGSCKRTTEGSGSVTSYFLTPADNLPIYDAGSPENLSLRDVEVDSSDGLNNLAHCRGALYKTEYHNEATPPKIVAKAENIYNVKYDQFHYTYEEPEALPLKVDLTAINGKSTQKIFIITADNQKRRDYIGFIRVMKTVQTNDNVETATYFSYNAVNGLPEIVRSRNSDGTQRFARTIFAFEQSAYSSGMGLTGAHMLSQPYQTIVYGKASSDDSPPSHADARSSTITTWSNTSGRWLPSSQYVWCAPMDRSGTPKTELPDFSCSDPSSRDPAWKYTGGITMYNSFNLPLEQVSATNTPSATIYSPKTGLPVASFANANYGYCIFSNYADNGITNSNGDVSLSNDPVDVHFSPKTLKITKSGADDPFYCTQLCDGVPGNTLAGKTFVWEFWAKADQDRVTRSYTFLQTEKEKWSTRQNYTLTTKWKLYRFTFTFPEGTSDKQYKVVVRPPYDEKNNSYTDGTIFFDDIRAYPEKALASHTYYDPSCCNPILSVDANNNAGILTSYDGFGRPITESRIDKENSRGAPNIDRILSNRTYILSGAVYALKSHANDKHVSIPVTSEPLIANATSPKEEEMFYIIDRGNSRVAIMPGSYQKYVSVQNSGNNPLVATRGGIGLQETFELIDLGEGKIALKALANGQYVSASNDGRGPLIANSDGIASSETFDLLLQ